MEVDLKRYFKMVLKRLWLIVLFVGAASCISGYISMYVLEPVYTASTKVIVNKSNDSPSGLQQLDINSVSLSIKLIDTYKEIIKTTAIMEIVSARYPDLNMTAEQLIRKVKVSSINETQVMTLVVEDSEYERAAKAVNAISSVFKEEIPKLMKVDNVTVLNEAKLSPLPPPLKPNTQLNIVIAFAVSLLASLAILFFIEYMDDTLHSGDDINKCLGIPTLAAIPKIKRKDVKHTARTSRKQVGEVANV